LKPIEIWEYLFFTFAKKEYKMKGKYLLVLLMFLVTNVFNVAAQDENRVEFDLEEDYDDFFVVPLDKNGVLLASFGEKEDGKIPLKMIWYSTDMEKLNEEIKQIPKKYEFAGRYTGIDASYILFYEYKEGKFICYKMEFDKTESEEITGPMAEDMYFKDYVVSGNKLISLLYDKKKAIISTVNLDEGSETHFDLHTDNSKVEARSIELVGNEAHVFYVAKVEKVYKNLIVRVNLDGERIGKDILIKGKGEDYVLSTTTTILDNNNYYVAAAYGNNDYTASGFQISLYNDGSNKAAYTNYYNFLDFEHFTDYLSDRTKAKIEKKQNKAEKKGKELELNYLMKMHQVKKLADGSNVLIAEFYYATYRTEYYTTTVNGRTTTSTRQVFDGYQYTHALVAAFDGEGKKIWDNIFEMNLSQKPFYARKFIRMSIEGNTINCLFANLNTIKSISFENGAVVKERSTEKIKENTETEKLKQAGGTDATYWYDNNFLITGYQKIVDKEAEKGKRRRRVFFMEKVGLKNE
jgi:hypothetical protein